MIIKTKIMWTCYFNISGCYFEVIFYNVELQYCKYTLLFVVEDGRSFTLKIFHSRNMSRQKNSVSLHSFH